MVRKCLLKSGKACDDCGECEMCDLDQNKICDNCCRCFGEADYNGVEITEIVLPREVKDRPNSPPKK